MPEGTVRRALVILGAGQFEPNEHLQYRASQLRCALWLIAHCQSRADSMLPMDSGIKSQEWAADQLTPGTPQETEFHVSLV